MDNETLATELLKELKNSSKRWFIISFVELVLILLLSGLFVWYISLPVEEVSNIEQSVDDVDASDVIQVGGDTYGNCETD